MGEVQVKWRSGSSIKNRPKAEVAHEELQRIEHHVEGGVTARNVVDESVPETAPLHSCFEWNNDIAADKYRCHEARNLINSVQVVVQEATPTRQERTVPAYVCLTQTELPQNGYHSVNVVMADEGMREVLLSKAKRELRAWQQRYENLSELASVFEAIDQAM